MGKAIYNSPWHVYIACCRDKTLYVGIAKDVTRRINDHNRTNKCRYTRIRKPITLVYQETCTNYSIACKRERELKQFPRKKKLGLIKRPL